MSANIISNVYRHSKQKSTKRLLLVILADQANALGVAAPYVDTLADYANVTSRQVTKHISGLEASNELFVYRRDGLHNVYIVLPGLSYEQIEQAIYFINTQFRCKNRGDALLAMDDLPPSNPSGVTPVDSDTPVESIGGLIPPSIPTGVPPSNPSGGPVGFDSGYKDSVVVVKNHESDHDEQQQQQTRPPTPLELELFQKLQIGQAIYNLWMNHDAVAVVAAILHATTEDKIESPIALTRAMLEKGISSPKRKYIGQAEKAIKWGSLDYEAAEKAARDEALAAANWDPRYVQA